MRRKHGKLITSLLFKLFVCRSLQKLSLYKVFIWGTLFIIFSKFTAYTEWRTVRWKNERAGIIKINEDEGSGEGAIIASLLKLCPEVKFIFTGYTGSTERLELRIA